MGFISIIIGHFIADFLLQPRWMGVGKSSSIYALISHVFVYSVSMWIFVTITNPSFVDQWNTWPILFYIFIGHLLVDSWTSRLTKYFYLKSQKTGDPDQKWMGLFWHTIGLDQTLHIIHMYFIYTLCI